MNTSCLSLQLLQKEKEKRLGCKADFKEIRSHEFFADVNWDDLDNKRVDPPYNPNVVSNPGQKAPLHNSGVKAYHNKSTSCRADVVSSSSKFLRRVKLN